MNQLYLIKYLLNINNYNKYRYYIKVNKEDKELYYLYKSLDNLIKEYNISFPLKFFIYKDKQNFGFVQINFLRNKLKVIDNDLDIFVENRIKPLK